MRSSVYNETRFSTAIRTLLKYIGIIDKIKIDYYLRAVISITILVNTNWNLEPMLLIMPKSQLQNIYGLVKVEGFHTDFQKYVK